ncbi:MAG TPA: SLC13 family permease [Candidatus Nanopelagicales bacterium]|nr:SLC13 family permease [Candidatus Nanopelagicales bacterium]
MGLVLLVFVVTYLLIAARRLSMLPIGRPAGALLGACAMVALGALTPPWGLTPHEAFAAIEPNTIGLLLGMMLLAAALDEAGFFEQLAGAVTRRRLSPVALLHAVTIGAGLLSALLVNDSVCVMATPLVDRLARRAGLPRVPYLLALAMGANAGSALTVAGNPQNMLVAQLSGISYRGYLREAGPSALLALLTTAGVLHLFFARRLRAAAAEPAEPAPAPVKLGWDAALAIGCLAAVSLLFVLGASLAWSALGAAAAIMLLRRRDAQTLFTKVEWTVLVFFGALFVVVAGLQKTGLPEQALRATEPYMPTDPALGLVGLGGLLAVASQIVSNVPIILLAEPWIRTLPDPHTAWLVTALSTTLAGNLTILGSVANIIVIETAGAQNEIGFRAYARVGVPVTIASTAAALGCLLLTR